MRAKWNWDSTVKLGGQSEIAWEFLEEVKSNSNKMKLKREKSHFFQQKWNRRRENARRSKFENKSGNEIGILRISTCEIDFTSVHVSAPLPLLIKAVRPFQLRIEFRDVSCKDFWRFGSTSRRVAGTRWIFRSLCSVWNFNGGVVSFSLRSSLRRGGFGNSVVVCVCMCVWFNVCCSEGTEDTHFQLAWRLWKMLRAKLWITAQILLC